MAALQGHIRTGGALECTLRRVATEVVEEDDPADTVFRLEQGLRLLEEDYTARGTVSIALDALLTAGAASIAVETDVKPAPQPSEEEKAADAAAKAARDAQWAEYAAAKAKAGGGKGGKDAKGGKAPAKKDAKGKDAKGGKDAGKGGKDAGKGGKDTKGGKDAAAAAAPEEAPPPPPHPFIAAATFAKAALSLSAPLNPRPPTPPPVRITAADLIPARPAPLAAPPGLDAAQTFRREVANAAVAIAREYSATIQRLAASSGAPGTAAGPAAAAAIPEDVKRRELLSALKGSGAYSGLKAALKAAAIAVARERFAHMPGASDPAGSHGRDVFVSHLYAHLVGQMHAAVNGAFSEAALAASLASGLESLGTGGAASASGAGGAGSGSGATAAGDEAASVRLRRIALECEAAGRYARAERAHQSRVLHLEEASARGLSGGVHGALSAWIDYAAFYGRRGALLRAVTCAREALTIDARCVPALLLAAAVQAGRGQLEEARVYAESAVDVVEAAMGGGGPNARAEAGVAVDSSDPLANASPLAHGLLALILALQGRSESSGGALLDAQSCLASLLAARGLSDEDVARAASSGGVWLLVSRAACGCGVNALARRALALAADALVDTDAPTAHRVELHVLRARWFLQTMNALAATELKEGAAGPGASGPVPDAMTHAVPTAATASAAARRRSKGAADMGATAASAAAADAVGSSSGLLTSPLHYTALGVVVPVSATSGRAYDGAPVSGPQADGELEAALALDGGCWEAWFLRAALTLSGLLSPAAAAAPSSGALAGTAASAVGGEHAAAAPSSSALPEPLPGALDVADAAPAAVLAAIEQLRMAAGHFTAPLTLGAAPFLLRLPVPVAAPPAEDAAAAAAIVHAMLRSSSGVGGAAVAEDEFASVRLHMLAASLHVQMSTITPDAPPLPGSHALNAPMHLAAARESYLRAAEAARAAPAQVTPAEARAHAALASELAGGVPQGFVAAGAGEVPRLRAPAKAWATALLGLGRVAWASGDGTLAEALLAEANVLDNQNPLTWAWLAFICLNAQPIRDREAAASVDQALKLGLVGDSSETVALLQGLADRYRELGQSAVALTLLERVLQQRTAPVSIAHAEGLAQAQLSLAQLHASEGAAEEAAATYRRLLDSPLPQARGAAAAAVASAAATGGGSGPAGVAGGAAASFASIEAARKVAARSLTSMMAHTTHSAF